MMQISVHILLWLDATSEEQEAQWVKVMKYKNYTTLISGNICHSLLEHDMTENTEFF